MGVAINCVTDVDIDVTMESGQGWVEVGGITGMNNRSLVANCGTLGDVKTAAVQEDFGFSIASPLVGFQAGTLAGSWSKGSIEAVDGSRFIGLVNGYVTIGSTYNCYYNADATMTKAGETAEPKATGAKMPSFADEERLYYTSGVVTGLEAVKPAEYTQLADKLNTLMETYPVDLTSFGLENNSLRGWTTDAATGNPVLGDARVTANYVRSQADYVYPSTVELRSEINKAKALNESDYTPESWAALAEKLTAAEAALSASEQADVDAAASALKDAAAALKKPEPPISAGSGQSRPGIKPAGGSDTPVAPPAPGPDTPVTPPVPAETYSDVKRGDWFHDDVEYVTANSIMNGTGNGRFDPAVTFTRAMAVTVLYRLEGEPSISELSTFTDVAEGQWYTEAVAWAEDNNIVNGYGDRSFGPLDTVTREQLAAIMFRYAGFKGYNTEKRADLSAFSDADGVSGWAREAMSWANGEGLVTGRGAATLAPRGTATRAEAAAILARFHRGVK